MLVIMKERNEQREGGREGGRRGGETIVIKTGQVGANKEFSLLFALG